MAKDKYTDADTDSASSGKSLMVFACIFAACTLALCVLAGCAGNSGGSNSTSDLMTEIEPEEAAASTLPDRNGTIQFNDFGIKLFKEVDDGTSNTCVSPLSVEYALGMVINGAADETKIQIEEMLGASTDEINETLSALRKETEEDKDNNALHVANSLWIKDGFEVKGQFLQLNANYYDAGVFQTPFNNSTVTEINQWVSENTGGMIDSLIDEISPDEVMFLVNALAFVGKWAEQYETDDIVEDTFTAESGDEQEAEFMMGEENIYLEGAGAYGFVKPYEEEPYAFVALLPDEGTDIDELLLNLDGSMLTELLENAESVSVTTKMPKFEIEFETELNKALESLGMTDAFDENTANFTNISEEEPLSISSVIHKTYVKVDEEGTTAAAATSAGIRATSLLEPFETVYLDRPFIYMIIDQETNTPIFIGAVRDLG